MEVLKKNKRPRWLTVLCIATMINTGLAAFSNFTALFITPELELLEATNTPLEDFKNEYEKINFSEGVEFIEKIIHMNSVFFDSYFTYHMILSGIFILGFLGAYYMFTRNQLGFHFYIVYSILSVGHIYFFVSPNAVPTAYVLSTGIISIVLIWLYSRYRFWFISDQGTSEES